MVAAQGDVEASKGLHRTAPGLTGRFKELDRVAVRILQLDMLVAGTLLDPIADRETALLQRTLLDDPDRTGAGRAPRSGAADESPRPAARISGRARYDSSGGGAASPTGSLPACT